VKTKVIQNLFWKNRINGEALLPFEGKLGANLKGPNSPSKKGLIRKKERPGSEGAFGPNPMGRRI